MASAEFKELMEKYRQRRADIKRRLLQFREVWKEPEERIFAELVFCFCTPQSNARYCDMAVTGMLRTGILFRGDSEMINRHLLGKVRFHNNKSRYIVGARDMFSRGGEFSIKGRLMHNDPHKTRDWLVQSVKGIGYKEASHFLRNIGLGESIAILDRHILRNLLKYGVIEEIPKSLTRKRYLEIEKRMKAFSEGLGIPMAELDLLFWSEETGEIFK
jgi:N-glycosylase/DNA lyase